MPVEGYKQKVYVRTDTTAPTEADEIDGIKEFSLSRTRDLEETTNTKNASAGYKTRNAQLKDSSGSMSGTFEPGDAVQALLRAAWNDGSTVYVTVHTDPDAAAGSKGYRAPVIVGNYDAAVNPSANGTFSCSLSGNGAVVDV